MALDLEVRQGRHAGMMSGGELEIYMQRVALPEAARVLVRRIRLAEPEKVPSSSVKVRGRYPSRRMGHTIAYPAHTVQEPALQRLEFQADVIEYHDASAAMFGTDLPKGLAPTFLVLREDRVEIEEWRSEQALQDLAAVSPDLCMATPAAGWRAPLGERYARDIGLEYRLLSPVSISSAQRRNNNWLQDFNSEHAEPITHAEELVVRSLFQGDSSLTLSELLERGEGREDQIYSLIRDGRLYVDLETEVLADPTRTTVYQDRDVALIQAATVVAARPVETSARTVDLRPGTQLTWDGRIFEMVNPGLTETYLQDESQAVVRIRTTDFEALLAKGAITGTAAQAADEAIQLVRQRLQHAGPKELKEANRRWQVLQQVEAGQRVSVRSRSLSRWQKAYRTADVALGCGFIGLIPKTNMGNRASKLADGVATLLAKFIAERFENLKSSSMASVYRLFCLECENNHLIPAAYDTFRLHVQRRPQYQQLKRRRGPRAAYKFREHWHLSAEVPRHGDRGFEVVHIDSTTIDLELVDSKTKKPRGRATLTIAVDAFSRKVLAFHLSFEPPSYRAIMGVLRAMVREFHRLPQILIVDNGPEHESVYVDTLLARHGVHKKSRPVHHPRYGGLLERIFGKTTMEFFYALAGNTQITKKVREATKTVLPAKLAVWSLPELTEALRRYFFEVYNHSEHPVLGESPDEAFTRSLRLGGARKHIHIDYQDFLLDSLPSVDRGGTRCVVEGRGIQVNGIYYWDEQFRSMPRDKRRLAVRYDPYDIGVAYAWVRGTWVQCVSEFHAILSKHSERELHMLSQELRQRRRQAGRKWSPNARMLAQLIQELESQESKMAEDLRGMRRQDAELALAGGVPGVLVALPASSESALAVDPEADRNIAEQVLELSNLVPFKNRRRG